MFVAEKTKQKWCPLLIIFCLNNNLKVVWVAARRHHSDCFTQCVGQCQEDNMISPGPILAHVLHRGLEVVVWHKKCHLVSGDLKSNYTTSNITSEQMK